MANGQAFEKWLELTEEQGGDTTVLENFDKYPVANHIFEFKARESGYVAEINAYNIGMASLELGAGRKTKEDVIEPAAGLELKKKLGSKVKKGETLAVGFTNNEEAIRHATDALQNGFLIEDEMSDPLPMVTHRVDKNGIHKL